VWLENQPPSLEKRSDVINLSGNVFFVLRWGRYLLLPVPLSFTSLWPLCFSSSGPLSVLALADMFWQFWAAIFDGFGRYVLAVLGCYL